MAGALSFPRHRALLAGVVAAVLAGHLGLGQWLARSVIGSGSRDGPPPAIEVAFVRELAPAAPPVAAAPRKPLPTQPLVAEASALPGPEPVPSAPEMLALADAVAETPADTEPESDADVPAEPGQPAQPFDWPPATRLVYDLTGQYRGPLHGSGQVDWLRDGSHYQVRITVDVDPVFTRRLVSDGEITPLGLSPRRYDEETLVTLTAPRTHTLQFGTREVQLSGGQSQPAPEGVQDSASQFVQMTWFFLTHPERLAVGEAIEIPLALPRRVGTWTYDVAAAEPLVLPFGRIDTFHLVPRAGSARPGEFYAELWLAPSLQYLPARILIRQDADTWLDLRLKDQPLQAEPTPPDPGRLEELIPQKPERGVVAS